MMVKFFTKLVQLFSTLLQKKNQSRLKKAILFSNLHVFFSSFSNVFFKVSLKPLILVILSTDFHLLISKVLRKKCIRWFWPSNSFESRGFAQVWWISKVEFLVIKNIDFRDLFLGVLVNKLKELHVVCEDELFFLPLGWITSQKFSAIIKIKEENLLLNTKV